MTVADDHDPVVTPGTLGADVALADVVQDFLDRARPRIAIAAASAELVVNHVPGRQLNISVPAGDDPLLIAARIEDHPWRATGPAAGTAVRRGQGAPAAGRPP